MLIAAFVSDLYERQPTSSNCHHQIQRPFFTISLRIHYYRSHQGDIRHWRRLAKGRKVELGLGVVERLIPVFFLLHFSVIRCRRRSEREIQDNSPIIVSSSGAKSHEVTIESSVPVSSSGVVTLPPTRTYPFDLVFGPEADQAMIYHDVVAPMLREVLHRYNCTLFAYVRLARAKRTSLRLLSQTSVLIYMQVHNAGRLDAHTNGQSIGPGRHDSSNSLRLSMSSKRL
jgi:hypothetical protein